MSKNEKVITRNYTSKASERANKITLFIYGLLRLLRARIQVFFAGFNFSPSSE